MKSRTLVAFLIVWASSLLLAALLSPSPGRASSGSNLLQNPGFEEGAQDWFPDSPTTTQFNTVTETVHSGDWAASLNRIDGVPSQIHIYQDVEGIIGGMPYVLTGWAHENSPNFDWVMLRIEWWGSSGNLGKADSQWLSDEAGYQSVSVGSAVAPLDATGARIMCIGSIKESPPESTPVFFDDLSFTFQGSKVYLPLVVKNY